MKYLDMRNEIIKNKKNARLENQKRSVGRESYDFVNVDVNVDVNTNTKPPNPHPHFHHTTKPPVPSSQLPVPIT